MDLDRCVTDCGIAKWASIDKYENVMFREKLIEIRGSVGRGFQMGWNITVRHLLSEAMVKPCAETGIAETVTTLPETITYMHINMKIQKFREVTLTGMGGLSGYGT